MNDNLYKIMINLRAACLCGLVASIGMFPRLAVGSDENETEAAIASVLQRVEEQEKAERAALETRLAANRRLVVEELQQLIAKSHPGTAERLMKALTTFASLQANSPAAQQPTTPKPDSTAQTYDLSKEYNEQQANAQKKLEELLKKKEELRAKMSALGMADEASIKSNADGEILVLDNGEVYEVDGLDRLKATLWLELTDVKIVPSNGRYMLINEDDDEIVHASRIK